MTPATQWPAASTILELAPEGILVSDDDGRILMANHQIEELFGYDRDRLLGTPVESLLPARLRDAHETDRVTHAIAPAQRTMGVGLELLGRHADGSEFPIEVSLSPAATDRGIATVAVIRDVSQQRALEQTERLALALDQDERIAADLDDAVIGHLFGSALTLASVLGRDELDDAVAQRLHDVIDELDTAIRQIRNTVLGRSGEDTRGRSDR